MSTRHTNKAVSADLNRQLIINKLRNALKEMQLQFNDGQMQDSINKTSGSFVHALDYLMNLPQRDVRRNHPPTSSTTTTTSSNASSCSSTTTTIIGSGSSSSVNCIAVAAAASKTQEEKVSSGNCFNAVVAFVLYQKSYCLLDYSGNM